MVRWSRVMTRATLLVSIVLLGGCAPEAEEDAKSAAGAIDHRGSGLRSLEGFYEGSQYEVFFTHHGDAVFAWLCNGWCTGVGGFDVVVGDDGRGSVTVPLSGRTDFDRSKLSFSARGKSLRVWGTLERDTNTRDSAGKIVYETFEIDETLKPRQRAEWEGTYRLEGKPDIRIEDADENGATLVEGQKRTPGEWGLSGAALFLDDHRTLWLGPVRKADPAFAKRQLRFGDARGERYEKQ